MEKGFNTDIQLNGTKYHIQTEDWGLKHKLIVSQIYCSGAVVKSIKTSYEKIFSKGPKSDVQTIRLAIREQHNEILDLLISGQL